jgi:hypothetical protein
VETFAVAEWKLEDAVVGSEDEDVASGVEDGGADLTVLEVTLHIGACGFVESVIEIAGDLVPNVAAIQNHENLLRFSGTALLS